MDSKNQRYVIVPEVPNPDRDARPPYLRSRFKTRLFYIASGAEYVLGTAGNSRLQVPEAASMPTLSSV